MLVPDGAANEDQTVGIRILSPSIEEPLRQIVEKAGEDAAVVLNAVKADEAMSVHLIGNGKSQLIPAYHARTGDYTEGKRGGSVRRLRRSIRSCRRFPLRPGTAPVHRPIM